MVNQAISALVRYGLDHSLLEPGDEVFAANRLLEILQLDAFSPESPAKEMPLDEILGILLDSAVQRRLCEDTVSGRDLFDTRLMGAITPFPSTVHKEFSLRYLRAPEQATDWFYRFCQNTDYIRRYRIAKDLKWVTPTPYGELDITINLSKPEKDPRAIASAKSSVQSGYPKCQLCVENEGYAGRLDHPARQTLRTIPVCLDGEEWHFQYSPYVYYNEHCIVLRGQHVPMSISRATFRRLLDFVGQFPHYFIGSNADLPIVGGSILSHDHFQGGRYTFAMERAEIEHPVTFAGFEDVAAGIVNWPMSVIRLRCGDDGRLVDLADRILLAWRNYSDASVQLCAQTDGQPHHTVTPIARMRDGQFELDLVLRSNLTTPEHPLGVYHPHAHLHHIKKENIGLIEVMGLAVLPGRLKDELGALARILVQGGDVRAVPELEKHRAWAEELQTRHTFTPENVDTILQNEVGQVFAQVLEHAGVYKRTPQGRAAFLKFIASV